MLHQIKGATINWKAFAEVQLLHPPPYFHVLLNNGREAWVTIADLKIVQARSLSARSRTFWAGPKPTKPCWLQPWIEDELDLGADNLRHLAVEQAGGIGHERIWVWLHDTGLTLEQAAEALGISRRMRRG